MYFTISFLLMIWWEWWDFDLLEFLVDTSVTIKTYMYLEAMHDCDTFCICDAKSAMSGEVWIHFFIIILVKAHFYLFLSFFSVLIQMLLTSTTTSQNLLCFMRCFWRFSCYSASTAKQQILRLPCDNMVQWWQWNNSVQNALEGMCGTHKVLCHMVNTRQAMYCWVWLC